MASVLSEQPPVFTMQQGSRLALEPKARGSAYYSDFQLAQGSHRYGTYTLTLVPAGAM